MSSLAAGTRLSKEARRHEYLSLGVEAQRAILIVAHLAHGVGDVLLGDAFLADRAQQVRQRLRDSGGTTGVLIRQSTGGQGRRRSSDCSEFLGKRWPCNAEEEPETHGYPKGQQPKRLAPGTLYDHADRWPESGVCGCRRR